MAYATFAAAPWKAMLTPRSSILPGGLPTGRQLNEPVSSAPLSICALMRWCGGKGVWLSDQSSWLQGVLHTQMHTDAIRAASTPNPAPPLPKHTPAPKHDTSHPAHLQRAREAEDRLQPPGGGRHRVRGQHHRVGPRSPALRERDVKVREQCADAALALGRQFEGGCEGEVL